MQPDFMSVLSFPIRERGPFRYVDTDPGLAGEPVVFLHGMLGDVSNWNSALLAAHAEGYRAVAPILPVYSIDMKHANLAGLGRNVREFLDAVDVDSCTLVGNSLGGHLAVMLAAEYPERVSALVLSGASGVYEVDLGSSIMRRKDRGYLRERVEKTFYDPAVCTDRLMDGVISIINTRAFVIRLISIARSVQVGGVRGMLNRIEAPTLLLWGKDDRITPIEVAETFRNGIADATLKLIDDCGHAPMMERPDVFSEHLLEFLGETIRSTSHALAS
jgi:pimeloyl-ACP methyl ester carboxylesterase